MASRASGSLVLPLTLRPEHRLARFVASLQGSAAGLAAPHTLVERLSAPDAAPWLMQPQSGGQQQRMGIPADLTSLPIQMRRQLLQLDEDAQRLHVLHTFFAPFADSATYAIAERASFSGAQDLASPFSPMSPPQPAISLPLSRRASASLGKSPPPLPPSHAAHNRCDSASCGLLGARLLLACRLPDYLLRQLKWLLECDDDLRHQRADCNTLRTPAATILAQQIDRVRAHCALMQEMAWKCMWRIEQLILSGLLSTCICVLPERSDNASGKSDALLSPWWNHGALHKVLRILTASEPAVRLGETAILSFIDLLMGENTALFSMAVLMPNGTNTTTALSLHPSSSHRSLKRRMIACVDMFPHLLTALSMASSPALVHEGLEMLSMLLIRYPDNCSLILRRQDWQARMVPLLLHGGVTEQSLRMRPRVVASKTLNEILSKETTSASNPTPPAAQQKRRASLVVTSTGGASTNAMQSKQSPEEQLAINLRLSLNLWVLLHYTAFAGEESLGGESMLPSASSSGGGMGNFFQLLSRSFDALEDSIGWLPHTILLVRVLLVSLLNKIASASGTVLRRQMKLDARHRSWAALFDLLAAVENFVFYSPLVAGGSNSGEDAATDEAALEKARAAQARELFLRISGGARRHASAISTATSANALSEANESKQSYLSRAPASRRFKLVGVHVSHTMPSAGHAAGSSSCDDVVLVQKTLEVLDGFRAVADQLCSTGGQSSADGDELVERESIKRLRKRMRDEVEFFRATLAYLQQCATMVVSANADTALMPELLDRRRNARRMSGLQHQGGAGRLLSGMLSGLTRGWRRKSLEAKLQVSVSDAAAAERDSAQTLPLHAPKPELLVTTGPGRPIRLAQRSPSGRMTFHDTVHTKVNVELALLKIQSHYVPHKQRSPRPGAAAAAQVVPPPVPARPRLKLDLPRSPPPLRALSKSPHPRSPLSPSNWAGTADETLPLSPQAAGTPRRIKTGRTYSNVAQLPLPSPPRAPAAATVPSITNVADKQLTGPIVPSPRHSGPQQLEPKEAELEDDTTALTEADQAEERPGLPCCSCCNPIVADQELWHGELPYCRPCFLRAFCACTRCAWTLRPGEAFVLLSGLEPHADLRQRIAPVDEDELIQLRSQEDSAEGAPDTLIYHVACLSCQAPEHRVSRSVSSAAASTCSMGSGMGDALEELEAGWFQHQGLIMCAEHYLQQHGESCAQCHTLIRSGWVRAMNKSWHASCFQCAGDCGRALGENDFYLAPDSFFSMPSSPAESPKAGHARTKSSPRHLAASSTRANKRAFCASCFQSSFELCHFCSQPIEQAEESSTLLVKHAAGSNRKPYHARCYQCVVCLQLCAPSEKLYAGEEPDDQGSLYCYRHYTERYCPSCPTCHEPVVDAEDDQQTGEEPPASSSVSVNGIEYHRGCLRCAVPRCRASLKATGADIYTRMVPASSPEQTESAPMQLLLCSTHRNVDWPLRGDTTTRSSPTQPPLRALPLPEAPAASDAPLSSALQKFLSSPLPAEQLTETFPLPPKVQPPASRPRPPSRAPPPLPPLTQTRRR